MVNGITFGQHAFGVNRINFPFCRTSTLGCRRAQEPFRHKAQVLGNRQLAAVESDGNAAIIGPTSNGNQSIFQRRLAQIDCGHVGNRAPVNQRMRRITEFNPVAASIVAVESVVEDVGRFDLFGMSHGTSERLGQPNRKTFVEIVFHCFFGHSKRECHGRVVVTRDPTFGGRVICDRRTFVFVYRPGETGEEHFFLIGAIR